jgi:ComF family protein
MPEAEPAYRQLSAGARRIYRAALDLVFPPRCAVCGCLGTDLCSECAANLVRLEGSVCPVCGRPQSTPERCERCTQQPPAFSSVRSAFRYEGGVRKAIMAFKYNRRPALAEPLAEAMAAALPSPGADSSLLCAVPLHPKRRRERGFNQAALLAHELGRRWGMPVVGDDALRRVRATPQQVALDYAGRQLNVQGAFEAQPSLIGSRDIVLVDDVCTTGATLDACAKALLAQGARSVRAVTLARAVGSVGQDAI